MGEEQAAPEPAAAGESAAAATVTTLALRAAGQEIPFRCFDSRLGKVVNREILAGEIYRWPDELPPPDVVVDVGANVGAAALFFSLSFPQARIVAFEPAPACHALLRENLKDRPLVRVEPYGLFDRDGEQRLFLGRQDSVTNSLGRSAFNASEGPLVRLRHAAQAMRELGIERIDCLKLDTEGSEVPILEALAPFLAEIAVLFVEYHSETDRRRIDLLMAPSHLLVAARVQGPHRGELTYARRGSFPDPKRRDRMEIRPPPRRGSA